MEVQKYLKAGQIYMSNLVLCSSAWLSCNSISSPGREVCKYLCISVEVAKVVLLLFWQFLNWIWQKASTVRAEGVQERLENTAESCIPQQGPALRKQLVGPPIPVSLAAPGAEVVWWIEQGYCGNQPLPISPSSLGMSTVHGMTQLSHLPACSS